MAETVVLTLASGSPRRKEILALLGVPFNTVVAAVPEEALTGETPLQTVSRLALDKARAVAQRLRSGVVIGADTIVVLDGAILGKPAGSDEATAMLRALRGRRHDVLTAVAVIDVDARREVRNVTKSTVQMRRYSDEEIARYVASGEPFDKAGGYAVQSESFHPAEGLEGCYLNVVGLPLCGLVAALCSVGFTVPPMDQECLPDCCRGCDEHELLARGCT